VDTTKVSIEIERLLQFAVANKMLEELDVIPARNSIMELLGLSKPYEGEIEGEIPENPVDILNVLLNYAAESGIIPADTIAQRDLMDARIMGILMPRPSEVSKNFWRTAGDKGIVEATDDFYRLSQNSNYIRMDRIAKNLYWESETPYGSLEITINLSKPEKDPKDIAAARNTAQSGYPQCLLCPENVGFAGNINHPARQNHRVIPLSLDGERWYFQYSPYVYYNEHCIVLYENHVPMKISNKTFVRLFDFVDQFPHYFIGSNADIPIVGGSILNHEHFQGGRHVFPMEKAKVETCFSHPDFSGVEAGIVKWPMSVIRLSGKDRGSITELASLILKEWREYSDVSADILAYTTEGEKRVPHNTITPIARKYGDGRYELDLVLRNNRTTDEHPLGIFHPHKEWYHVKKENIGLIEVMGLAILPGRLNSELREIEDILDGKTQYTGGMYSDENHSLNKHIPWIEGLIKTYGTNLAPDRAKAVLKKEVGDIFLNVLLDAGVYKRDSEGKEAFKRFMNKTGFR
jgi:galactose-1-phosphate uridylyltransferase, family 2